MTTEEIRAQHPDPEAFDAWLVEHEAAIRRRIAKRVNSRNYSSSLVGSDIWATARCTRRVAVDMILGS